MPTYEYKCRECGKMTEFVQTIRERSKRKCPHCGRLRLKRMMSGGASFIFKGPGFYVNDYPKDKK